MTESAYIHIPFCKTKCKYCSFVSETGAGDCFDDYINALSEEIAEYYRGENLKTIYLGGGTPSLLGVKQIERVLQNFIYIPDFCEISFEMNPDDVDLRYLKDLHSIGVNRISIGAQSFDDNLLTIIGRRHNSAQVFEAVEYAQKAGFKNISVDLMYGLPEQTIQSLKNDLDIIVKLGVQHVSTYGLKIEEPCAFYSDPPENLPNDDIQADMYIEINDVLEQHNFKRYEISNFSKPNCESKHNLNYWKNRSYYGFGLAAHGYDCGIRYSNNTDLKSYIQYPTERFDQHIVTAKEKFEEEIFLGFRKESGININKIKEKYGIDFEEKYKDVIEKYSPKYLTKSEDNYKLTLDGILLSNNILAEFIE